MFRKSLEKRECIPVGYVPPASQGVSTAPPPRADPGTPLDVGLETQLARSPSTSPLGMGLETPRPDPPQLPPLVWTWEPARHAGIPPHLPGDLLQGMLGYHLQCMLGYHPSPRVDRHTPVKT